MASSDVIEDLFYEDKLFPKAVLDGASYLYDNSILCDVGLLIEGQKIEAHKSILASASLYFRGMFCTGLKETGQREITIHDVDYKAMDSVIRFFYTSLITLTEDNIFEIVNVADLLGVVSLHSACIAFLQRSITVHNCVSIYALCQLHGYQDVAHRAVHFACRHFSRVMELDEFLEMPADMLLTCVESKVLNVYSDNGLLNKICEWVKYDVDSRGQYLQTLLDLLNIFNLDLKMAESSLYQLPTHKELVFTWVEKVKVLCERARERNIMYSRYNKQRFNKEQQVILSCGGLSGGPMMNVEALALSDSIWRCMVPATDQNHGFRVIPPLKVPRIYAATTYTDAYVYLIGGRGDNGPVSSVERYCVEANEWDEHIALPEPLEGAAAANYNGSIYVTGGFNTGIGISDKTWVLEPGGRSWRPLSSMRRCRSHHGLLAVNGYIYAVAGAGVDGDLQACMERMSVHTQQWQSLLPLQEPRSLLAGVVFDNSLFITGGVNAAGEALRSVQVYDTLKHEWASETPLSVGRHSHGATVAGGRIYIAAGTDGIHQLSTCEMLNPHTHLWHVKPSLTRSRVGQAMATITIPMRAAHSG